MSNVNFEKIDFLPIHDLYSEFTNMLDDGRLYWFKDKVYHEDKEDQICLNLI